MNDVTCGECHHLLLDLAYGELDPLRAAEVEAHAAGCEACGRELKQIASTRMLVSPLLRVEEPSAAMDEPILKAARAEAQRFTAAAGGSPRRAAGPRVLEVVGSIGMPEAAAPVDARAPLKQQAAPPPARRRWALRVALGGSIAAAAGLALIATNLSSNSPMRAQSEAGMAQAERAIRIRVPDEAADKPIIVSKPASSAEPRPMEQPKTVDNLKLTEAKKDISKVRASPPPMRGKESRKEKAADPPAALPESTVTVDFGDDAPPALAKAESREAPPASPPLLQRAADAPPPPPPPPEQNALRGGLSGGGVASSDRRAHRAAKTAASADSAPLGVLNGQAAGSSSGLDQQLGGVSAAANLPMQGPSQRGDEAAAIAGQLEARARTLRMSGSFSEAATLYKQAAALHARAAEAGAPPMPATNQAPAAEAEPLARRDIANQVAGPAKGPGGRDQRSGVAASNAAALDLAHAVECYAADARIDEARRTYEDLLVTYPGATVAHATAQRALRTALPSQPAMKAVAPADAPSSPEQERPAADAVSK